MIYSTVQGDTFDLISKKTMGDEEFTGLLMEANPAHMETVIFNAGELLTIPERPAASSVNNLPPWRASL